MHARRNWSALAFAHFAVLAATAPATAAAGAVAPGCTLAMALEQWPPYLYTQAGGAPAGLDFELARAILREAGCTLRVTAELPPARRQRLFQSGQLDLLLAASDTAERRRYGRYSLAYRHETVGLFSLATQQPRYRGVTSLEELARQRLPLLAPRVGWYGPGYAALQPRLEQQGLLSTFLGFQQGIRMLAAGRAGLLLGDVAAVRHAASEQQVEVAQLQVTVLRAPVHLLLNRISTTPEQLAAIDAAIRRLEQRGALGAIRARYGAD